MNAIRKVFRGVLVFFTFMIVGGFVFCSQDIVKIYEAFYGTFSWESVTCLLVSAFVAGLSFRLSMPKKKKKENHDLKA